MNPKRLLQSIVLVASCAALIWANSFHKRKPEKLGEQRALHIDPVYERVARETGGTILDARGLTSKDPKVMAQIVQAMVAQTRNPNTEDRLLVAYGEPSSTARVYHIPVDSSVEYLKISAFLAGLPEKERFLVEVLDSIGRVVDRNVPGVEISVINNGTTFSIPTPQPGRWQVRRLRPILPVKSKAA